MTSNPAIIDPSDWRRFKRGKMLQFFASDEEVQVWLDTGLLAQYAPYFIAYSRLQYDGTPGDVVDWIGPEDFLRVRETLPGVSRFWVGSELLSGQLPEAFAKGRPDPLFAVNGLLLLQHGFIFKGRIDASAIGITDRIERVENHEVRTHQEYVQIFQNLSSRIKRDLRYSTIDQLSGTEEEDDRLVLMTEGAKRASESGVPFASRPGRLLKSGMD